MAQNNIFRNTSSKSTTSPNSLIPLPMLWGRNALFITTRQTLLSHVAILMFQAIILWLFSLYDIYNTQLYKDTSLAGSELSCFPHTFALTVIVVLRILPHNSELPTSIIAETKQLSSCLIFHEQHIQCRVAGQQ